MIINCILQTVLWIKVTGVGDTHVTMAENLIKLAQHHENVWDGLENSL